ncbi:g1068 [Coccomyxa elongata]
MSVTFRLHNDQRLCDICRDPERTAKGNRGIVANTRVACQKHTTKHHGGPAILAVLSDLDGAQDPISAGIGDAEPIAEAREGRALTRPPNQTQDLQAQEGESSRGSLAIYTPRSAKRKRCVGGHGRPLGTLFTDGLLNMVQREFDKQYRELRKALKEENEENDMRYRALLEDCQGEVVLKDMEIEGLKRKLHEVEKNVKTLFRSFDAASVNEAAPDADAAASPRDSERTHSERETAGAENTAMVP